MQAYGSQPRLRYVFPVILASPTSHHLLCHRGHNLHRKEFLKLAVSNESPEMVNTGEPLQPLRNAQSSPPTSDWCVWSTAYDVQESIRRRYSPFFKSLPVWPVVSPSSLHTARLLRSTFHQDSTDSDHCRFLPPAQN